MEEANYKKLQLTATHSQATPATEYEPRFFAEDTDIIQLDFSDRPQLQLTQYNSFSQTPDELAKSGRLLLGIGASNTNPLELHNNNGRFMGNFVESNYVLYTKISIQGELKTVNLANFTVEILSQVKVLSIKDEIEELNVRVHSNSCCDKVKL